MMLSFKELGMSESAIAQRLGCARKTVSYWLSGGRPPSSAKKLRRLTPKVIKTQIAHRRRFISKHVRKKEIITGESFTPKRKSRVVRDVVRFPFSSPAKISRELDATYGIVTCASTVRRDLRSMNFVCRIRSRALRLISALRACE